MARRQPVQRVGREQLRALAHPTRVQILEALREGAATGTEIAARVGESTASVSYHLRALARAGLVDADPRGTSRGRPQTWRRLPGPVQIEERPETPDERAALAGWRAAILARDEAALRRFVEAEDETTREQWERETPFFGNFRVEGTAEEIAQLVADVLAVFDEFRDRNRDPDERLEQATVTFRVLPERSARPVEDRMD